MPSSPAPSAPGTFRAAPPAPAPAGDGPDTDAGQARRRVWLAALHQLALADGDFSEEEESVLADELERELPGLAWEGLHLPGSEALAHRFGVGSPLAEEFLGTAVVVALADGHVSPIELEMLRHWSAVLQVGAAPIAELQVDGPLAAGQDEPPALVENLRRWLDGIEPSDPVIARFLVRLIPAQCPFERDIVLFGRKLVHIPPMCTINPLYEQLVALRFRCLCRLEAQEHPPASPLP